MKQPRALHSILLLLIAVLAMHPLTAAAQPTPVVTATAPARQFRMQAPHSMQAARLTMRATVSPGTNTPCGQTMLHIPQLLHSFGKYRSVFVFSIIFIIMTS